MPYAQSAGISLYYEEAGTGFPVVFVHELAGDSRDWEDQMRFLSQQYRVIAFNARGYPPSDVPGDGNVYGQDKATDDIAGIMHHLGISKAHVVGLSQGAAAALHFGLRYTEMATSLVITSGGSGSYPAFRDAWKADVIALADRILKEGMEPVARDLMEGPARVQLRSKS